MRSTSRSQWKVAVFGKAAVRSAKTRRRFNWIRILIVLAIVIMALGAFVLHLGIFRFLFRGMLVVGAIALFGSYFWGFVLTLFRQSRGSKE